MDEPFPSEHAGFDARLLARMTNRVSARQALTQKADALAADLAPVLARAIGGLTGARADAKAKPCGFGTGVELASGFLPRGVRALAGIDGFARDFVLAAESGFVVTLAETLLGGSGGAGGAREPSPVEIDIAAVLFEEMAGALVARIRDVGGRSEVAAPRSGVLVEEKDACAQQPCVLLAFEIVLEGSSATIGFIVPEAALEATEILCDETAAPQKMREAPAPEWADRLSRRVSGSQITLTARLKLERSTLGEIADLAPGDVLRFADPGALNVFLHARDRTIGECELGRSGERYMLRLKDGESLEAGIVREASE
ncbi:FliM/FliN family flagellar motor switch protein [Pararhizobium mangrovi]|nr:FliM/FliN family flagellar motor switch protein [Pararhizobium mangrovi]